MICKKISVLRLSIASRIVSLAVVALLFSVLIGDDARSNSCPSEMQSCVVPEYFFSQEIPDLKRQLRESVKTEKKYAQWGEVKRRGVLSPITTLYNVHTKEVLPLFERPAVKPLLLQHFFRCRGFGETIDMAPELIETIVAAAKEFEAKRVTIISGYRSTKFNDALAKKGRRVASESRHMRGQAVDFRLDSADALKLGNWLKVHFEGGVGTYKVDDFVHIDVGPKRSWWGH